MSESDAGMLQLISRQHRLPWYKGKKLDQWLCFCSVPLFYILFGIVFVPLSWMMPPRSPANSIVGKVEFMQSPNLLTASAILVVALGLAAVSNAVYMCQMRRMPVSPAFRFAFLVVTIPGAIVGCLFPMFCFGLGAFRPGYRPEILAMLYDADAFLSSQQHLNQSIGVVNTVVLLTSSLLVALGTTTARDGKSREARRLFGRGRHGEGCFHC